MADQQARRVNPSWLNSLRGLFSKADFGRSRVSRRGRSQGSLARRTQQISESLEPRLMLTLHVSLDNGNLLVQETSAGVDNLEVSIDPETSEYIFRDAGQALTTSISEATGGGPGEIRVPAAIVTGGIRILTGASDDSVTVLNTFGTVSGLSVSLDLEVGNDTVQWNAAATLDELTVVAETTALDVEVLETVGRQDWKTVLQLSGSTSLIGAGITLADVDLGQHNFVVSSTADIAVRGGILNGGSGDVNLDAHGGILISDGQVETNAGNIFMLAAGGGLQLVDSAVVSGSGNIYLEGRSFSSDGLAILNSSVATSANGAVTLRGAGGPDRHGILIEGTTTTRASIATQNRNIDLYGFAGSGDGHGILLRYGKLSTNNGSMALAGLSDRASAAGTLLEHSEILVTGNGNVALLAGSQEEQFGSGSNRFSLEFGQVGSIFNAADTTGAPNPAGSVGYEYQMGRYEISRDMIEKANAAAGLGITLEDMSDRGGNGVNRPATGISWYEAAQFVNWLNTSKGYSPAYKFVDGAFQLWTSSDEGYDSQNPYRNLNAKYVIPSMDEWYKAAFYDPVTGQYFDFGTGSNSTPASVTGGTEPGTAVYGHAQSQGPADITSAGGLSPYGMMAMSGNVFEWIETAYDTNNSAAGEDRFLRGGAFSTARDPVDSLKASDSFPYAPTNEGYNSGFRVVSLHHEFNGLVRLDDASISVKSGVVQVEGGLEALGSTITTTTGGISVSSASAGIRTLESALTSASGYIVLDGDGTRDDVSGIELADTAVSTGGTGIVTLTGRGGITASGVLLKKIGANGTQIQTGGGAITIEGIGGDTAGNGIQVDGASVKTTAAGSIVLRGAGSTGNSGILLQGDGSQTSQISTQNGNLTLQGWAGDGGDAVVATKYRVTTTGEGSIVVLGSVNGAGTYAFSATDSTIAATGSGNIDFRAESRQYQFSDTSAYWSGNPAALEIDFTTIGAPGNDDDTSGNPNPAGKVDYVYQIGTYEISRGQIEAYNAAWGTANGLAISLNDMTNFGGNGVNRAATGVSWNEAARFVNWLNTSQGYQPAYKFTTTGVNDDIDLWTSAEAGYDSSNPYRNSLAKYVLPSMDEWYKAAYYDPATTTYRDYASTDGTLPQAVKSGTDPNTAVYNQSSSTGPADYNQAGGLNAFGVMGMSGNLWEWEETSLDLTNSSPGLLRALNGGSFSVDADGISSSSRGNHNSTHEAATTFGFRVATLLTHNPTEILLNHTTLQINTGALTVDAENIVLQGQESVVITSGSDQWIASDFSGSGHLRKLGAAQLTLSGDYATTAVIYVRAGTLNIAGRVFGNVRTESDANGIGTLVGTGTITGNVTASGNSVIAPGGSAGILRTGHLDLQSAANLQLELGGSTAGNSASSHDQVVVTGQVQLAGNLELSLINSFTPGIGDVLLLISNDGTDAIFGTFTGLNEGARFASQGLSWQISYVGGTGNDVTITRLGSVFDVVNLDASGAGSLFQAITDANTTAGEDLIRILTTGVLAVTSSAVLPHITDPVRIDGTTAPDYSGVPLFEVRGTDAGNVSGLVFTSTADESELVALSITDFAQHGVVLSDAVTLTRNWIGVDLTGAARGNDGVGVRVLAAGAVVGDGGAGSGNVISGNLVGVEISGAAATGAKVQGNLIGLNPAGTAAIANATGIRIDKGASSNLIGTDGNGADDVSERNIISGNSGVGILLSHNDRDGNAPGGGDVTHLNTIAGNYIGTTPDGAAKLSNGQYGIHISALVKQTLVGTDANGTGDAAEGNLISGNTLQGIVINGNENTVAGNLIGTNATQTAALNNGGTGGIFISGADNVIGGSSAAARNIISGNNAGSASGVRIEGATAKRNKLQGNYIGLASDGTALGNSGAIAILHGADDTQVGGTGSGEGNVLSGSTDQGIYLKASARTLIQGNRIGTNPDGTAARGNNHGIYLTGDVTGTVIGGSAAGAGNLISGNRAAGIYVDTATGGLQVQGNLIGTMAGGGAAIGNNDGIVVIADNVVIGGTTADDRNVISGNTRYGVDFRSHASLQQSGNVVQGNFIGTSADGLVDLGNASSGIRISTDNVQIGGVNTSSAGVAGAGNLISGNDTYGIEILSTADSTVVQGNLIGVDATGGVALANTYSGVYVAGTNGVIGTNADGTTDAGEANVISGNTLHGIHANGASGLTISGNLIGLKQTGAAAAFNQLAGIRLEQSGAVKIGRGDGISGNVIGSRTNAIEVIDAAGSAHIAGNILGLTADEQTALLGATGIYVLRSDDLVIGTDGDGTNDVAEGNVIAGMTGHGILLARESNDSALSATDSIVIAGNSIGLRSDGSGADDVRSGGHGILNYVNGIRIGTDGDGVSDAAEQNIIASAVNYAGVTLTGTAATGNVIAGNRIGLNAANVSTLVNYGNAIRVYSGASGNRIGTDGSDDANNASERNLLMGGIHLVNGDNNTIAGNYFSTADGVNRIASSSFVMAMVWLEAGSSGNIIGTDGDGTKDDLEANIITTPSGRSLIEIAGDGSDNNVVAGNRLNINVDGSSFGLVERGVFIYSGATGNRIGTDGNGTSDSLERNVVGGTRLGMIFSGSGTDNNVIAGNYIGVGPDGETGVGNTAAIIIQGGAAGTRIGTDGSDDAFNATEGNLISANGFGIQLTSTIDSTYLPSGGVRTSGTIIAGNRIGLTASGQKLSTNNGYAIEIRDGVTGTRIGTNSDGVADASERNVISGSTNGAGIQIFDWRTMHLTMANEFIAGNEGVLAASGTVAQADLFQSNSASSTTTGYWQYDHPLPGGWASINAYRATGKITVSTESVYTFVLTGADGGQLKIGGNLVLQDGYGQQNDTRGTITLAAGSHTFEWRGYSARDVSGAELSVAVGNVSTAVSEANGWRVLGAANAHSEIALDGVINVDVYHPNVAELATVIAGNHIGTSIDGQTAIPNSTGVAIYADGVKIGGSTAAARNIIAGNVNYGVIFGDTGILSHSGNFLSGNYIGVAADGMTALPNGTSTNASGVIIGADNVQVGGAGGFSGLTGAGNLISGSRSYGIELLTTASGNVIQGNYIGTTSTGNAALANVKEGIAVFGDDNQIGGSASGTGNLISGNTLSGVLISGGTGNSLLGNRIGTNAAGTAALPNGKYGVLVNSGASDTSIGSGVSGTRNLISGHSLSGVMFDEAGTGNLVQGNYIGTAASGAVALPNATDTNTLSAGVMIYDAGESEVIVGTDGDGTRDTSEGNLISGNRQSGVLILGGSAAAGGHTVAGNSIGVNAGLNAALPNRGDGVRIVSSSGNLIGSDGDGVSDAAEANQIAGNSNTSAGNESEYSSGVLVIDTVSNDSNLTLGNVIAGNAIGTDRLGEKPLPNQGNGITVISAKGTRIGGSGVPNLLRFNALAGVRITGTTDEGERSDLRTSLLANSFQANDGLPVDLGDSGQDLNTSTDSVLDFPVFTSAAITDGVMTLEGFAESGLTFDLYLNAGQVGQKFGDGVVWLARFTEGSNDDNDATTGTYGPEVRGVTVSTGALTRNKFSFQFALPAGVNNGVQMTGIASSGGVSEFSSLILAGEQGSAVAPEITLENSSDPVLINELVTMSVDGSFYDPDSTSWTATVDYGDGDGAIPLALSAARTFTLQHIYDTPGSYTVTVQIVDAGLAVGTAEFGVTVANVAPDVDFSSFDFTKSASEGGTVSLSGSFVDGANAHVVEITWGDSETSTINLPAGTLSFAASHVYADDTNTAGATTASDIYAVEVTIRDAAESTGTDSPEGMFLTEISNVRPTLDSVLFNGSALGASEELQLDEGATLALTGAFTDPGTSDVNTVRIDWGDGTIAEFDLTVGDRTFSGQGAFSHVYANDDDEAYTVVFEMWDDDEPALRTKLSRSVKVVDVAASSVVVDVLPASISEGQSVQVSGTFVDPGSKDAHQVRVSWGDGSPDSILNVAAGVLTYGGSALSHTYLNNRVGGADYPISVVVSDLADVAASGSGSTTVGVTNVAPVAGALSVKRIDGSTGAIEEGERVVVTGSFTDVSAVDRHRVTISWGDGTTSNAAVDAMNRTFTATHRYLDNYEAASITATVVDGRYSSGTFVADGGASTTDAVIQQITNVAPIPTIAPVAGSTPTLTKLIAEVVDPGLDDIPDLTYEWQIGDGLGFTTVSTSKVLSFNSTLYFQPLIRLLVSDDDGGDGQDDVVAVFGTDVAETITITDSGATISSGGDDGLVGLPGGSINWANRILVLGFGGQDTLDATDLSASYTAILDGGQLKDFLFGGAGEDVFYPNDGNDYVSGGSGDDSYVLTPNSTLTVLDVSGDNVLDFRRTEFGDATGIVFDLSAVRNTGNLADFDEVLDTQLVSTANGSQHEVAAFGNFTTLLGSNYGDTLTIGSNASVDGGAGADTISLASGTSNATVYGGADDDILLVSGTNITDLTFSGDDGLDLLRNVGEITGLTFGGGADDDILENTGSILGTLNFGGDDGIDILTNTGTIGDLIFNGGADDDIFINNGSVDITLDFGGDDDLLLSGSGTIGSLTFSGDDGADIFANLGTITSLTFNGGADDDIFINVGTSTSLNFGGDDDVLLSNDGSIGTIGTLVFSGDDGIDEFRNFGEITTLTFNGGADNDIFTNYAGATLTSLTFGGDDGLDLLRNAGNISGLTFNGGADDDTLLNTLGGVLSDLVFGGDAGSDILTNYGSIDGLTFSGGADDDVLTNVGTISSSLNFGGDDGIDTFLNSGTVDALTFGGGADDDILTNYNGGSIATLGFGGDDGIDTISNYGTITTLDFGGGADADILVNGVGGEIGTLFFGGDYESDGNGGFTPIGSIADNGADILGNYGSITTLLFRGGADDDVLVNYSGGSLGTLNFGGDDGLDILRNDGTVTTLTFGGGADDDTLINNGTVTGILVFGGDQQFSATDELEQIANAADDGVDILANYGTLGGVDFTGGADDDILLNDTTGTIGTLVFGGDAGADILQNLGTVTSLTFHGGADDDLLLNSGSGLSELIFSGDDGADILFNEGGTITNLTFSGGADDDLLLNTASSIANLTFNGGADDDVLQNTGDSVVTLSFTGDAGLDVLLNTGSGITTLSFGGGADNDILSSTGDNIGVLIFGGDLDPNTGEPIAGTNGGNDTLIVSGSGTGAADSRILFSGDDGADAFQNDATGFASIIFNGGADNDVFQNNASSIGGLVFNGGADDDVLENNGSLLTSLVFGGDDGADVLYNTGNSVSGIVFTGGADADILLNTGDSLSGIIFSGDAGADIFSNRGAELSSLTFTGGADDDIFLNTGAGISDISFNGDDGADLFWNKSTGINASSLSFSGDDGADILINEAGGVTDLTFNGGADDDAFQNSGVSLSGLIFNGGADDDTLLNTSTGAILTLSFGGDDGNDILQTVGAVTTLNFGGGADDDILTTQGTIETLVFMGDGELDNDGHLVQISAAGDDGVDTLLNEATVGTLTFTGGADDDVFVNNNRVTTLTFSGGADDDTFQNNAYVFSLTFSGGADDDVLINNASGMPLLVFSGDDGFDSFVNNGNNITSLTFEGGADADILRIHGAGIGNITFTGGADAAADTFHFNGTAAAGSTIAFIGGDGDDVFAWRGTADGATFTAGAGNDTSIIQGSGSLTIDGGSGNDNWIFEADPDAAVSILETWSGDSDSSSDSLDFSSFTGGALTIDLRSTTAQVISSNLTVTLSDARGIENVTGTPEADTIYGNLQNNIILGAEYSDGYGGAVAADRGVTQWVLLDFDTYSEDGEHVYTTDERNQIMDRVETLYRGADTNSPVFDVRVVQTRGEIPVADGQFATIYFNDTPAFGRPGGLASEIDPGNLSLGGTAVVQVNGLLGGTITADDTTGDGGGDEGGDKGFTLREIRDDPVGVAKPDATSENFVLLSAKIAAHELAHLMGLRHADSFGPIGLGIHDPPGIDGYNPVYRGPVAAVETFDHLLGSGASVGTDRFNDLRDLFFSERSAMKLAFATADTADVFTIESSSAHSTAATAQILPLTTVDVPNTLGSGLNASKEFYVQMQSVEGTIGLDAGTGKSENDWYSFTGTAGDVMNIELFSNSLTRYGSGNDDYIDSLLRVWYEVGGDLILVPWFGSDAVNDDIFEPTDSALVDLILPSDGVYYIEIDTFKRDPNDPLFDETDPASPLNPANPNNYLSYPDLLDRFLSTRDDTDIGRYQLFVSRFDRGNASDGTDTIKGFGGVDTIDAGEGDDYSLTVSVGGAGAVNEGASFSRSISLVDRAAESWAGSSVNYGDGTGDISVSVAANGTATLSHTFADSGVYTVSVTIRDDIGQEVTETFDVTVSNVAPTVDTLTGELEPDESTTHTYSFTASDPGDDTFTVVEISGGTLGTVSNIQLNSATGSGTFDVTFGEVTSGATAATTLTVTLKDSDNAQSNVKTLAVTVQNVGTGPEDISLSPASIEENADSGTEIGTLSTTDSSGQTSFTYSLVSGDGDTDNASFSISGNKLLSAVSFDYEESATRLVRIRTADPSGNTYEEALTISITNIADEEAPVSDLADLPPNATSMSLTIEASGTDTGDPASGIASFALYYSTGGAFTQFATVTPASPSTVFVASANTTYWFRSLATDVAGNTETKNTNDAYTVVGDIVPPASEVTSVTAATTGLISVQMSGSKPTGRQITRFDVYMSVDSGAAEKIASVNSLEVSAGVYSGTVDIQGIVDGVSHQYAFYTRAVDGSGNIEDAPGTADKTITATFSSSSLTAQKIDVQRGANQRSYIRYLDVLFSDDPTDMLDPGRVAVERFALDATSVNVGTGTAISGFSTTRSGNTVQLDFGAAGLGGLRENGDGFYRVMLDMDNDGSMTGSADSAFEFYRMFGDANGDREVSNADLTLIQGQMNRSGDNLDADIDGSGRVTGADFLLGRRRLGKKLRDWLFSWLDD